MNAHIVSIVTPSFNQEQYIEETIRSVLSQEGDFYIDYILVDGKSSDQSVEIIKKYERLLKDNCKTVEVNNTRYYVPEREGFPWNRCRGISYRWKSEADGGQVEALNKGFKMAKGQILGFINSDDAYTRGTFDTIVRADWEAVDFIYGEGVWTSRQGRELLLYPTFKPTKYSLFFQCTMCQPTVFLKQDTFRQLGEFSPDYRDVFDYEYWLRAIYSGKRFFYINKVLAKSRMYRENKTIAQKDSIGEEIRLLKQEYYNKSRLRLSKIKLLFTGIIVQRKSVVRVNKLFKYIGIGRKLKFWKHWIGEIIR